ncbi:MAG: class I SAM-dependent methyltransferase [Verrucomicrobiota bacterium]
MRERLVANEFSRNLSTALAKRKDLFAKGSDTNAYRLINGPGDGFRDLVVDDFNGHWIAQTKSDPLPKELWETGEFHALWWKRLAKEEKEAPELVAGSAPHSPLLIRENSVTFAIDPTAGYSCGLFLDQRENRKCLLDLVDPGQKILNTFAYTCGFSVAAATKGANTTSVDLSGNYLEWGKRNFKHNGLETDDHHFSKADVFERLAFFAKKQILFHGIVLDPPTFSRSKSRGTFRVESDYGDLVELATRCLDRSGWILCCANTHRLSSADFTSILQSRVGSRFAMESVLMPPDFAGSDYLKSVWLR